ncbi:MAG TPA: hypothetical protein VG817_01200 [Gemmatimonadales bacterium]|nr:hypothetical protein [Gemmatimonadales bacterium]
MIRRLRDRHRQVIPLLALLAAVILLAAILARHPRAASVPPALQPQLEAR